MTEATVCLRNMIINAVSREQYNDKWVIIQTFLYNYDLIVKITD